MEPATQALAAIALSRTGLNKLVPRAMPILLVSAIAPDLDYLSALGGAGMFLRCHRTLTHSLVGGFILALILASFITPYIRRIPVPPLPGEFDFRITFFRVLGLCLAGIALHILLDLSDAAGLCLYWPFRATWQGWYLTPNLDPIILIVLVVAIVLPELFKLVSEEIGERKKKPHVPRRWALAAFAVVALYLGARALMHSRAMDELDSAIYRGEISLAAGAYPDSISPYDWRGIVSTDNTLQEIALRLNAEEKFDPELGVTHYKPAQPQVLAAAEKSRAIHSFISYARFPLANVQQTDSGWHIELRDLRLRADSTSWENLAASVDIDTKMQPHNEEIRFVH